MDLSSAGRSAHSIHGIHRPIAKKHPQAVHAQAKPHSKIPQHHKVARPLTKKQRQLNKIKTVPRSPHISKFGARHHNDHTATLKTIAAAAITHMSPNYSYQITTLQADSGLTLGPKSSPRKQFNMPTNDSPAKKRSTRKTFRKAFKVFTLKPRFVTIAAVSLSGLLLAIYVGYLSYPQLSLRVAASRAGIDAKLPRYTPSGYSFRGPIIYGQGLLTVRFTSNSDNGFISLTQQKTTWDSASLLENHVKPRAENFLTFQKSGLTIYIYNGTNAAWVNNGVWYTIEGNNYLNSEQITQIASSIQG